MIENQTKSEKNSLHSIDELIFELKESVDGKKLAVFCGAGIAFNSGLPLAKELVREILIKLDTPENERENIILRSDLPFESFIETLRENSNADKIFDIFNLGEPNITHILLAKLAKAKYLKTICTTNFDQLIEKALEKEGLKQGADFEVYYKEDDFDKVEWNNSKIVVLKLHGSVEDRENMAITLKQVTNRVLSIQRQKIIEHIFSKGNHEYVLVLGYSCSDLFDVSPAIEAIQNSHKKVILVEHNIGGSVNQIERKDTQNSFKKFSGSKWVLYDTDKLIESLWDFYFPDHKEWKEYVSSWYSENDLIYGSLLKYSILGDILFKIAEYIRALPYYQQALSVSEKIGNKGIEIECLGNLGSVHAVLGQNHEAIEFFEKSYNIAMQISDIEEAVNSLGNMGVAYFNLGEYYDAIKYQEQALSFAKQINDKERMQTWLGNLGNIYMILGEYHKAVDYYKQAINMAIHASEKHDEGLGYGNMGMAYLCLHEYAEALKYFELSLTIARQLGDKHSEGVRLGNLGNTYLYLGEYTEAIKNFGHALQIAEDSGDKYGEVGGLSNLGTAYGRLGKYTEAIDFFKRSLTIAQQVGDQYSEGIALSNLGNSHTFLTEFSTAIEYYDRALAFLIPILGDENPQVKQIKANIDIAKAKGKI
jgi:tetratricopeptide (TPR) repeat protein